MLQTRSGVLQQNAVIQIASVKETFHKIKILEILEKRFPLHAAQFFIVLLQLPVTLPNFLLPQELLQAGIAQDQNTQSKEGYHYNRPGLLAIAATPGIYNPHIRTGKLPKFSIENSRGRTTQVIFIFYL